MIRCKVRHLKFRKCKNKVQHNVDLRPLYTSFMVQTWYSVVVFFYRVLLPGTRAVLQVGCRCLSANDLAQPASLWAPEYDWPGSNELCFPRHKDILSFLCNSPCGCYVLAFFITAIQNRVKRLYNLHSFYSAPFFLLSRRTTMTSSAIQLVWLCAWALQWCALTAVIFFIGGNWKFRDTGWPLQAGRNKSLYFQLPLPTANLLSHPPYGLLKIAPPV